MGNTDCCCTRGKSDKLPNDDPLKPEEVFDDNQSISSKNRPKILETDGNFNNLSQSFSSKGGNDRNTYMSDRQTTLESDAKIFNNFQTFGGEIINIDGYTSNNIRGKESDLNAVNSQNRTEVLKVNTMETGNSIKIPNITRISKKIFIKISIESLSITYKKLEDFGIFFNPFVVIKIESEIPHTIYPIGGENSNLTESNLDKSLNTSGLSDLDNTMILNMSQIKSNTSLSIQTKKEKILNFKFSDNYEIPSQYAYTKIMFIIKNENIPGIAEVESSGKKSITFPPITLGEAKIPLNIIYKNYKGNSFEGNIELKLRENITFGYLKVKITASDKLEPLKLQDQLSEKLNSAKFLDYETEDSKANYFEKITQVDNIFDLMSNQSLKNSLNLWEEFLINYEDLNPIIFVKYFTIDIKVEPQEALILASKIPRSKSNLRHDTKDTRDIKRNMRYDNLEICKLLSEIIKQNNHIALFQLMNYLVDLSMRDDFNSIEEIWKSLNDKDKEFLVNLPKTYHDNVFVIRLYLIFVSSIRINKDLEDKTIIINMIEIFNQIYKKSANAANLLPEYILEMRDCAMISLNITSELITHPIDVSYKMSFEEKKHEYNAIYDNCLQVISARNSILRLLQFYLTESQIIGIILRIFRKIIQVLTNDNSSLLDEKQLKPKDFSKSLRKFLINQHEGVFISTLKSYLLRYHHYPEAHQNILFIVYQLTNHCDSKLLYFTAEKINLNLFSDVFETYRGRIKNNYFRTLNNAHLSVLSNLCEVDQDSESYKNLYSLVANDLKSFYSLSDENKKRKEEFIAKKLEHIEIHEIVTRLGVKLTKDPKFANILKDSFFYYDLVEYVYTIAYNEFIQDRKVNKKTQSRHTDFSKDSNSDFISKIKEKKKNFNSEEIGHLVSSILENTLKIFLNLISSGDNKLYSMLTYVLNEYEIKNFSLLNLMLESCINLLGKHEINPNKLGELINELNNCFEEDGNEEVHDELD